MEPVLILGAGINGSAIARELLLNGLSVVLVDTADIAYGATAYSSRLIHGGLRYLEYGEFALVRESLSERGRLLRLAPQFVHPLELFIPIENRFGDLLSSVGRFFGWRWWPGGSHAGQGRGLWLIGAGLRMYDAYARDATLPRHRVVSVPAVGGIAVDPRRFRWLASYYDAQITFPERFVLALLQDAKQIAAEKSLQFDVLTRHRARLSENKVDIQPVHGEDGQTLSFQPSVVINATGAWVDDTLSALQVPEKRLMGGTKGSHIFTYHALLARTLGGRGVYAEARDGRPIFILPLAGCTMIGTTDEPFEGDPADALASGPEIDYLLASANAILPQVQLTRDDVAFHYSGVRPLPYVHSDSTAAVTRRHWLAPHTSSSLPIYSVIGGKLTTCRSLAEDTAAEVLARLNRPVAATSRERLLLGADNCPTDAVSLQAAHAHLATRFNLPLASIAAMWTLFGTQTEAILATAGDDAEILVDTFLPVAAIRHCIRNEWCSQLDDLVERRLMLLYHQPLTRRCLLRLCELLCEAGRLTPAECGEAIEATVNRLQRHFGKQVVDTAREVG